MINSNETLPDNIKQLLPELSLTQAIPLGSINDSPFVLLKISEVNEQSLGKNEIACEMKPSIFNVKFKDETIAICFVQFRLNKSNEHIYTTSYNLRDERQFEDCFELLNMHDYGLLVASKNVHEFLKFDTTFKASFNPQNILIGARDRATDYTPGDFLEITHALQSQAATPAKLWKVFDTMAPFDQQWYASMEMNAQKA